MKELGKALLIALVGLVVLVVGGLGGCAAGMAITRSGGRNDYDTLIMGGLIGLLVGAVVGVVVMFQMAARPRDPRDGE